MTKILLVEDDKNLREIYGVRLLAEGYDIVSAGDGEEALAMAIKERPQLIVSDVMMPKISGFDMLDILRSTTETKDIKVIIMTALSSEEQRTRGESLGADKYLVKSQVGIEDVVRAVHEVLSDNSAPKNVAPTAPTTPVSQPIPTTLPSATGVPTPAQPVQATPQSVDISIPVHTPSETPSPVATTSPVPMSGEPEPHTSGSERVINPLPSQPDPMQDISARIQHELSTEPPVQPMNTEPLPPQGQQPPTTQAL